MRASDIFAAIRAAHAPPEWACFAEVANGTGSDARRRADAIAMNLWPSRGLAIRGFEIKVSRSDLKREQADPEKAETIAAYCDEWWIVGPKDLVRDIDLEIPLAWGLMEVGAKGLHTRRRAEKTEAKPLPRAFVAAVLRRASEEIVAVRRDYVRRDEISEKLQEARKQGAETAPLVLKNTQAELARATGAIRAFAGECGIDILENGYSDRGAELGRAVKVGLALLGRYGSGFDTLLHVLESAGDRAAQIRRDLEAVVKGDANGSV